MRTTKSQSKYWEDRDIDWDKEYFQTWSHPHRYIITSVLNMFQWGCLLEMGVGGGANLKNIISLLPNKLVGGIDISQKAIDFCTSKFNGGVFKRSSVENIELSDNCTDVSLSDMTYIYVGPFKIKKCIRELRRISRGRVVLCEFYEPNPFKRLWLYLTEGYFFYNWPKLLRKQGFYDIMTVPLPKEAWEEGLQTKYCYLIMAKVPKRY